MNAKAQMDAWEAHKENCDRCGKPFKGFCDAGEKLLLAVPENACWACGEQNTQGRSPTGSWCKHCGHASPGYYCAMCKRESVNPKHHTPDGVLCAATELYYQEPKTDEERKKWRV